MAAQQVAPLAPVQAIPRPDAPYDLTDDEAAEWWAIVNRMPGEWFPRETHALLAQYCRHVVSARHVALLIQGLREEIEKEMAEEGANRLAVQLRAAKALDRLQKMQEREGRAMSSLATRMRITQQSTYDKTKKKPIENSRPWDE